MDPTTQQFINYLCDKIEDTIGNVESMNITIAALTTVLCMTLTEKDDEGNYILTPEQRVEFIDSIQKMLARVPADDPTGEQEKPSH